MGHPVEILCDFITLHTTRFTYLLIPFVILISSGLPGSPALAGPDYVDYGAYTGGYGAYGWYTDHPVLVSGYH